MYGRRTVPLFSLLSIQSTPSTSKCNHKNNDAVSTLTNIRSEQRQGFSFSATFLYKNMHNSGALGQLRTPFTVICILEMILRIMVSIACS